MQTGVGRPEKKERQGEWENRRTGEKRQGNFILLCVKM